PAVEAQRVVVGVAQRRQLRLARVAAVVADNDGIDVGRAEHGAEDQPRVNHGVTLSVLQVTSDATRPPRLSPSMDAPSMPSWPDAASTAHTRASPGPRLPAGNAGPTGLKSGLPSPSARARTER